MLAHPAVAAVDVLDLNVHAILRALGAGEVAESEPERLEAVAGFAYALDERLGVRGLLWVHESHVPGDPARPERVTFSPRGLDRARNLRRQEDGRVMIPVVGHRATKNPWRNIPASSEIPMILFVA